MVYNGCHKKRHLSMTTRNVSWYQRLCVLQTGHLESADPQFSEEFSGSSQWARTPEERCFGGTEERFGPLQSLATLPVVPHVSFKSILGTAPSYRGEDTQDPIVRSGCQNSWHLARREARRMPPGHCMESNSILWDSSALDLLMENLDLSEEEGATSLSNAVPFSGLEGAMSQSEFLQKAFFHLVGPKSICQIPYLLLYQSLYGHSSPLFFLLLFLCLETVSLDKSPDIFMDTDLKITDGTKRKERNLVSALFFENEKYINVSQ